jgi:IS30 family transposase
MEVDRLIEKDFSPEQISNRLKLEKVFAISHETIYQRIYQDKRKGRRTPFAFTESEATPKTLLHWSRTTRDDQEPYQHC